MVRYRRVWRIFVQPDPKVAQCVEIGFVTRLTECSHTLLGLGSTAPAKERISSIPKGVGPMDDPSQENYCSLGVFGKCNCPLVGYPTIIKHHSGAAGHVDSEILPQLCGGETTIAIGALVALPPWD